MKNTKRSIALFLAIILALTGLPGNFGDKMLTPTEVKAETTLQEPRIVSDSSMEAGQKVTWDCVWFGSYPQTEIVDRAETCGTYGKSWGKSTDYVVDGDLYDQLASSAQWRNDDTIQIGNTKYCRIRETDAVKSVPGDDSYYDWSRSAGYHYFRYDKIKWRVFRVFNDSLHLIADKSLDAGHFNVSAVSLANWKESTIRSWLNGYGASANYRNLNFENKGFIDKAFSDEEKNSLVAAALDNIKTTYNAAHPTLGNDESYNTTDKMYLQSLLESCNKNGYTDSLCHDEARRCLSSSFAKAMGLECFGNTGTNCWWLRSTSEVEEYPEDIYLTSEEGRFYIDQSNAVYGVRPVCRIAPSSSSWSYAGTVCSDGTVDEQGGGNDDPDPGPEPELDTFSLENVENKWNGIEITLTALLENGDRFGLYRKKDDGDYQLIYTSENTVLYYLDEDVEDGCADTYTVRLIRGSRYGNPGSPSTIIRDSNLNNEIKSLKMFNNDNDGRMDPEFPVSLMWRYPTTTGTSGIIELAHPLSLEDTKTRVQLLQDSTVIQEWPVDENNYNKNTGTIKVNILSQNDVSADLILKPQHVLYFRIVNGENEEYARKAIVTSMIDYWGCGTPDAFIELNTLMGYYPLSAALKFHFTLSQRLKDKYKNKTPYGLCYGSALAALLWNTGRTGDLRFDNGTTLGRVKNFNTGLIGGKWTGKTVLDYIQACYPLQVCQENSQMEENTKNDSRALLEKAAQRKPFLLSMVLPGIGYHTVLAYDYQVVSCDKDQYDQRILIPVMDSRSSKGVFKQGANFSFYKKNGNIIGWSYTGPSVTDYSWDHPDMTYFLSSDELTPDHQFKVGLGYIKGRNSAVTTDNYSDGLQVTNIKDNDGKESGLFWIDGSGFLQFPEVDEEFTFIDDNGTYVINVAGGDVESNISEGNIDDISLYGSGTIQFDYISSTDDHKVSFSGTSDPYLSIHLTEDKTALSIHGITDGNITVQKGDSIQTYPVTDSVEIPVKTTDTGKPDGGNSKPAKIPVNHLKITGISHKIAAGRKIQLKATVLPKQATNKKLKWTSSNTKIATVTQSGKVTIRKKTGGKPVIIKATATDGSKKSASWKITVMKGVVKSVKITGKKTVKAGKTIQLKAIVKATKGKPVNKKLKWTSSNTKYATVTQSGKVKALKKGKGKTVRIKAMATDGTNKSVTWKIKIK